MMKAFYRKFLLLLSGLALISCLVIIESCEKDISGIYNPYDDVDYGDSTANSIAWDSNSITGIHKMILATRCANPGCHDGTFEPDFRSVQSSYSTLVYHPIIKNNAANDFSYRVIPGDTAMSVLHERITNCCFVNPNDRMPQDNIGEALPDWMIAAISQWILDGAKDWSGQSPTKPSTKAQVLYYLAFNSTLTQEYSVNRIDSLFYNPFIAPNNETMNMAIFCTDDETPVGNLQINRLEFSYVMNDFSNPILTRNATFLSFQGNDVWTTTVNTNQFLTDTIVYMRYIVSDGQQSTPTIAPKASQPEPFKTYWSFYVSP